MSIVNSPSSSLSRESDILIHCRTIRLQTDPTAAGISPRSLACAMTAGSQDDSKMQKSPGGPKLPVNRTLLATDDRLMQPGLEVAAADGYHKQFVNNIDEGDKEVVSPGQKEAVNFDRKVPQPAIATDWPISPSQFRNHRLCGLKRSLFWALLIATLVILALGAGLGVGLALRNSDEPPASSTTPPPSTSSSAAPTPIANDLLKTGGSIDPDYYSTSGAWNGSGIAWIWQNFAQDWSDTPALNEHSIVVYYQHHSGEIRWLRQTTNSEMWQPGPSNLVVVASNARNATPITAVHYDVNQTNYWHVFCEYLHRATYRGQL